jgi:hypothetical protein
MTQKDGPDIVSIPSISEIDNIWRHWWSGHMAAVGATSRLPLAPISPDTGLVAPPTATFSHLADILERLDDHFVWIKRFHKVYTGAGLYSRIGAVIVPDHPELPLPALRQREMILRHQLGEPEKWPAVMMRSYPHNEPIDAKPNQVSLKLLCFTKMKFPGAFIPVGNVFYEGLAFFTKRSSKRRWSTNYFYVGVDRQDLYPLRTGVTHQQLIRHSASHRHSFGSTSIVSHHKVGFPPDLVDWLAFGKAEGFFAETLTVENLVRAHFIETLDETIAAEKGIQVSITKDRRTVKFAIPMRRSAYFFKDREFHANIRGSRRKIFHYVSPHRRTLSDGRQTTVAEHYRGERVFGWKGYKVVVTVPNYHHVSLTRYDVAASDADIEPDRKDMISIERAAESLRRYMLESPDRTKRAVVAP